MTVSVLRAAKHLAEKSDWTLSNLEMQKLLYLAHMFHLGRTGDPLVHGNFEAWDYGPVHPSLYHFAKVYGADPVQNIFYQVPDLPEGSEREIIDEAYEHLGKVGPGRLVRATHRSNGAWEKNYDPNIKNQIIPNEDILREFRGINARKR